MAKEVPEQVVFVNPTRMEVIFGLGQSSGHDIFVGRDQQINDIVELLDQEHRKLKTNVQVTILGPHGIGKTALARSVCNDARVKRCFAKYYIIWIDVVSEFDYFKVSKNILDQIIGKDSCITELGYTELLDARLYEELHQRRFLIVLDGVTTKHKEQFDKLRITLDRCGGYGCSVMVTSSSLDEGGMVVQLQCLKPDDGWDLFCKKAFSEETSSVEAEIVEMARGIVGKCGGSPLEVNMLGGLMRSKKEPAEWRKVINQLEIFLNDDIDGYDATLKAIIKVCYNNLSSQAQQCLALCSMFPKGQYMDKEVLLQLWMANGLLLPPIENGDKVFNELASRNFFDYFKLVHEGSPPNKYGYHSRVRCRMPSLIHDQAVVAAEEFALQIRYLYPSDVSQANIPELLQNFPSTRVLACPEDPFTRNVSCSAVPTTNSLRALHLQSALFERDLLEPKYMRHLRYLNLSGSRIRNLPETTTLLYFLQTLNLSNCILLYQLPQNMKDMRCLTHLDIQNCPELKTMPPHFRHLSNLQTLSTYFVGDNAGNRIDEIKGLQLSGLLELYNLHMVKTSGIAQEADLVSKKNLDRLTLCWGSEVVVMSTENNDLEVLEALQPPRGLKLLKVQQYGGSEFASWLANPVDKLANLVELHLIDCSQCKTLPAVWELSSLRVLCLKRMPSMSTFISGADEEDSSNLFPRLKRLVLIGLNKLERWHERAIVIFPLLEDLEITNCPNLKTMPSVGRIRQITIRIENCELFQSVLDLITDSDTILEVNIAKVSNVDDEPFPALEGKVKSPTDIDLQIMRMDTTNALFMPTTSSHSLLRRLWKPFGELISLEISNCDTLVSWPQEFKYLVDLHRLSIRMCPNLTGELPARVNKAKSLFPSLKNLQFYECSSLKEIPKKMYNVLELEECPQVKSLSGIRVKQLLSLSCTSWTSLPSGLSTDHLTTLRVSECPVLESLPDEMATLCLQNLVINECPMLKKFPGGFETMLSGLENFQISKCPELERFCEEGEYSTILSQIGEEYYKDDNGDDDK